MALTTGYMVRQPMTDDETAEDELMKVQALPRLAFAYIEHSDHKTSLVVVFREQPPEEFDLSKASCARAVMTEDHMCFK